MVVLSWMGHVLGSVRLGFKRSYVERMLSMAVCDLGVSIPWCLCKSRWLCVLDCYVVCWFHIAMLVLLLDQASRSERKTFRNMSRLE